MPSGGEIRWPDTSTAGEILKRIRQERRDELEKGESFEKLFRLLILQLPDFEVKEAYRWKRWPDRERLTNLPLADSGIDMVARLNDGSLVAIQCKCYDEKYQVDRREIDKFLAVSGRPFDLRWLVATCKWGKNAEEIIHTVEPPVRRIDFHEYDGVCISEGKVKPEKRDLFPLQAQAVENVMTRLSSEDRGQLIMACGTGKTYIALHIFERLVPDGGRVLFLAPSIALVSQARHEWLTYKARPLRGLVVCSDQTSGGRGESDDIRVSELKCQVTTKPDEIASALDDMESASVVFCTYQSLSKVSEAQLKHGAPDFDLIIADEAHRTTGIGGALFTLVHDSNAIRANKRMYMTATDKIYTLKSKSALESKGYTVYDMDDHDTFGEPMYRLTFKKAVNEGMLSDYRVVVLAMRKHDMANDLYDKFLELATDDGQRRAITREDAERLVGTALAINGITGNRGNSTRMSSVLGFANSRKRSRAFTRLLNMPEMHRALESRLNDASHNPITMHKVEHLDGNSSALRRNQALRNLERADAASPRMINNVKLFTEGVDVPSLDAVAFLDPRDSTVDVVQAVGRVMRRAPGKQFGYIIIPVLVEGENIINELETNQGGWKAIGRVLRALHSHDGRLPENLAQFLQVYDPLGPDGESDYTIAGNQEKLGLQEIGEKFYAKVVAGSGLAKPGQMASEEIESEVNAAGDTFMKSDLAEPLAGILGLEIGEKEYKDRDICRIAALLIVNACLLHRRLQDELRMKRLASLDDITGSENPRGILVDSWTSILEKDYAPVFEPAMSIMEALPEDEAAVKTAIYRMVDRANSVADSLSELGYDHSGPLYHKILGTAKSDSANYTGNVSALMLARLAFTDDFANWNSMDGIKRLRIMDPACGTGTLLMAALKTIKDRMNYDGLDGYLQDKIHRRLIEDVFCGMDINRHAVQLAACNLTLGAPTVEYKNMNLYTMKHGPQPGSGEVKAGSAEILLATSGRDTMKAFVQPMRNIGDLQAKHVDDSEQNKFPLEGLDVIIMNPPFGSNMSRSRKFPPYVVKRMQKNELAIKERLKRRDKAAGEAIDSNSIRTFFTPLADRLLNPRRGTLAKVLPATACISASGLAERKFLADRFHVERIITSHDPKHINFSYKTSIHECLMICRRHNGGDKPPTEFVSLRKMPKNAKEAIDAADAIANGNAESWGSMCRWPAKRVSAGDWTPVQWHDDNMAGTTHDLESSPLLEPIGTRYAIGPVGRGIRDTYMVCEQDEPGAVKTFHSISTKFRKTICSEPESWHKPKPDKGRLAERYWKQRSGLLVAERFDTISGRLTALYSNKPSIGSGWVPVRVKDERMAKALAVWWNSTPSRMMLLNRRTKKLTYPQWSLEHLREIRIPKPDNPGWSALYAAYNEISDKELLPMGQAVDDPVRAVIDEAAAQALEMGPNVLAGWRTRLSREPTMRTSG